MFSAGWTMLKQTVLSFINDEALSRGAAIAFYTVTSIAPVLLIVIAIAGLAFGRDAAENAITEQLSGLMGQQTAEVLQTAVRSASNTSSGVIATIIGVITLIVTASPPRAGSGRECGHRRPAPGPPPARHRRARPSLASR